MALLSYARAYGSLKAPAAEAWKIYFTERIDFWLLLLLPWRRGNRSAVRPGAPFYCCGPAQASFRYSVVFSRRLRLLEARQLLLPISDPIAMGKIARAGSRSIRRFFPLAGCGAVGALAVVLGWHGNA